jgi:hypothetical protein
MNRRLVSLSVLVLFSVLAASCQMLPGHKATPSPTPTAKPAAVKATPKATTTTIPTPTASLPKLWVVPDDYKSLTDAIQVALPNDIIHIRAGTINIDNVVVDKPLTIYGDDSTTTILSGTAKGGILTIKTAKVTITAITVPDIELVGSVSSFSVGNVVLGKIGASGQGNINIQNADINVMNITGYSVTLQDCRVNIHTDKSKLTTSVLSNGAVNLTRNIFGGNIQVSVPTKTTNNIKLNTFTETALFTLGGSGVDIALESNNLMSGRAQVTDNSSGSVWQRTTGHSGMLPCRYRYREAVSPSTEAPAPRVPTQPKRHSRFVLLYLSFLAIFFTFARHKSGDFVRKLVPLKAAFLCTSCTKS